MTSETRNKFVDSKDLEQGSLLKHKSIPPSKQAAYPLLKPILFTNQAEDDYLDSGVWILKKN